jgi:hypothetical protein
LLQSKQDALANKGIDSCDTDAVFCVQDQVQTDTVLTISSTISSIALADNLGPAP